MLTLKCQRPIQKSEQFKCRGKATVSCTCGLKGCNVRMPERNAYRHCKYGNVLGYSPVELARHNHRQRLHHDHTLPDMLSFNRAYMSHIVAKRMVKIRNELIQNDWPGEQSAIETEASRLLCEFYKRAVAVFKKHVDSATGDHRIKMRRYLGKAQFALEEAQHYPLPFFPEYFSY